MNPPRSREPFMRTRARARVERPRPEDMLMDLVDLHTELPGVTEECLGALKNDEGRTSYEALALSIPQGCRRVLDLGTGNGPLVEALLAIHPTLEHVLGVDACAEELSLARERFPKEERRVSFSCSEGRALQVGSESMDAVLSHHAFYLMVPVEPVVQEIARVLRPGGCFAFSTMSPTANEHPLYGELMRVFGPLTARDNPCFQGWGDRRVWSEEGLSELFVGSGLFEAPKVTSCMLSTLESPESACARLMAFYYSVMLQNAETQAELRETWLATLKRAANADGLVQTPFPGAIVSFERSA